MDLVPQPFDWLPSGSGEKRQPHHGFGVSSVHVNIFRWLPCGWNHVCWKSVIEPPFFWRWCNGVMDSVCYFYLLGKSVGLSLGMYTCPLGIFPFVFIPTPFFLRIYNFSCLAPWIWCFNHLTGCPSGVGKTTATPWIRCVKCTCKHLPMTPVWIESCVLEVRP